MNRRSAGRSAFKSSGRIAPRRKSRPSRGRFAVHLAFAHSSPVPWEAFEMVFGIPTPSGKAPIGFSQAWRTLAIHAGAEPYSGSGIGSRSEEHTSELQSRLHLVCRLLLEKKNCSGCYVELVW